MNALLALPFLARVLLALGVAAVISYLATPYVKKLAFKIGAVDVPKDNRRMHKKPIPRLGGLAIVIAFLLCTFLFVKLEKQMQGILLGAIIILVVGVLDDCLALPALPKFFAQIAAGTIVADKIGNGAVTEPKIAGEAVTTPKIGALAVTNGKIGGGAVSYGKTSFTGTLDQVGINKSDIAAINALFVGRLGVQNLVVNGEFYFRNLQVKPISGYLRY